EPALALITEAMDGRTEPEGVAGGLEGSRASAEADAVAGIRHLLAALDRLGKGKGRGHPERRQLRRNRAPVCDWGAGSQRRALERVVAVVDRDRDERGAADAHGWANSE